MTEIMIPFKELSQTDTN